MKLLAFFLSLCPATGRITNKAGTVVVVVVAVEETLRTFFEKENLDFVIEEGEISFENTDRKLFAKFNRSLRLKREDIVRSSKYLSHICHTEPRT